MATAARLIRLLAPLHRHHHTARTAAASLASASSSTAAAGGTNPAAAFAVAARSIPSASSPAYAPALQFTMARTSSLAPFPALSRSLSSPPPSSPSSWLPAASCAFLRTGLLHQQQQQLLISSSTTSGRGRSSGMRGLATVAADSALVEAIDAEIKHEEETYEQPEEVAAGVEGWTVESSKGTAEVVLRRNYHGEDIAIMLSVSEAEESYDDLGDEPPQESDDAGDHGDEDEEEPPLALPAKITITKADGAVLTVECVVQNGEWVVDEVGLPSGAIRHGSVPYTGPAYETLDERLQAQFSAYLERRGINSKLANFVQLLLDDKEQREYVGWLKRVAQFVDAVPK